MDGRCTKAVDWGSLSSPWNSFAYRSQNGRVPVASLVTENDDSCSTAVVVTSPLICLEGRVALRDSVSRSFIATVSEYLKSTSNMISGLISLPGKN